MLYMTQITLKHWDAQTLAEDFGAVVDFIEKRHAARRAAAKPTPAQAVRAAEAILTAPGPQADEQPTPQQQQPRSRAARAARNTNTQQDQAEPHAAQVHQQTEAAAPRSKSKRITVKPGPKT